jgi:hypothetical protein
MDLLLIVVMETVQQQKHSYNLCPVAIRTKYALNTGPKRYTPN